MTLALDNPQLVALVEMIVHSWISKTKCRGWRYLEEVEKRAYDDILNDDISLEDSILHELSIHLINLPLTHLKLINLNQPSIVHVDEFPIEEALLRFIGFETPHKKHKPPSTYVCKIDIKGYFGENAHSSGNTQKEGVDKNQKKVKATK